MKIFLFSMLIGLALFTIIHAPFDVTQLRTGIFLILMSTACILIFFWRREVNQPIQQTQSEVNIAESLSNFKHDIEQWQLTENMQQLLSKIDEISEQYLLPLNHQHQIIHSIYGQQSLDIILNLAQSERLLNRMQSAALDGYEQAVQASFHDLQQTIALLPSEKC
jgi:hypothetical protein